MALLIQFGDLKSVWGFKYGWKLNSVFETVGFNFKIAPFQFVEDRKILSL